MTTIYDSEKGALNVTLVSCEPNTVRSLRTQEKDRYQAIQLEIMKTKRTSIRKEFRTEEGSDVQVGQIFDVTMFTLGERVQVSGISKAKGFQGVVKRHGFAGSPKTHGHKHDLRAPGSIGSAFPQHVFKGMRMAGRMGGDRVTVQGLQIVMVDPEKNMLAIQGAIPGVNGNIVEIVGK